MNTPEEYIAAMQPKLCVNCKHIGRNGSGDAKRYRCFHSLNLKYKRIDLVTGADEIAYHFETCYDARAEGVLRRENCGPEGKWFEAAPPRFEEPSRIAPGSTKNSINADYLLSQLDKLK